MIKHFIDKDTEAQERSSSLTKFPQLDAADRPSSSRLYHIATVPLRIKTESTIVGLTVVVWSLLSI